ncbi:hypothetical protein C8R44DRAFT_879310 [Mycena epipterygia]|nr:hypothetical protein C8R44DRAFT_879310 [Mycena epipterygia]
MPQRNLSFSACLWSSNEHDDQGHCPGIPHCLTACLLHFASPMRLTRVLVAAIKQAEETYCEAIEAGVLSKSDLHIARLLSCLQVQVSHIREATLRNSLSRFGTLCDFSKGRTFTVLNCITESRALEAHIEKNTSMTLMLSPSKP